MNNNKVMDQRASWKFLLYILKNAFFSEPKFCVEILFRVVKHPNRDNDLKCGKKQKNDVHSIHFCVTSSKK